MATHVALLRGINVGGNNKVPMADLREGGGLARPHGVSTYIRSGNVLFTARAGAPAARPRAGGRPREGDRAGLRPAAAGGRPVPRRAGPGDQRDDPYRAEPNPKYVHAMFFPAEPGQEVLGVRRGGGAPGRGERAAGRGHGGGPHPLLHTPDGSWAQRACGPSWPGPAARGRRATARNMATVTKLLALWRA